jgi:hypothetical protein
MSFEKIKNIDTFANVIQSIATLVLVVWGIFFSPLSEYKEIEREKLKNEVELLKETKNELLVSLDNLEKTKQNSKKYLDYLLEISCNDFIKKIKDTLDSYKSDFNLVDEIEDVIVETELSRNQHHKKLSKIKEEQEKCWTDKCINDLEKKINEEIKVKNSILLLKGNSVDFMLYSISDKNISYEDFFDKKIKEDKEKINSIISQSNKYNLFLIIKNQLEINDFSLVTPEKQELLRKKILTFLKVNSASLSKPLMINRFEKSKNDAINKNYSEAYSKIIELNNILLSSMIE